MDWPRRKPQPTNRPAVTAAATRQQPDPKTGRWKLRQRETWQEEAFDYLDTVPELSYATTYVENAFGKIRLVPGVVVDEDEDPSPIDADDSPLTDEERATVRAELGRLRSASGGQSRIVSRLGAQLFLVGECYLIGRPAQTPPSPTDLPLEPQPAAAQVETWDVLSVEELVEKSGKLHEAGANPDGSDKLLPDGTLVIRVHQEHLRRRQLPTSSVKAVLDALEELSILNRVMRATGKSRIAQSSIIGVPDELDVPPVDPDVEHVPLATRLLEHFVTPISDEGSASAAAPFLITGKAEALKAMKDSVITIDRPFDKVMAEQRLELRTTIATGIDLPAEVLTGIKDVNHWTAWAVDEQKFKDHLEPRVITTCDALTVGWLHIALTLPKEQGGHGWSQDRADLVVLWYDASRLIKTGDPGADADNAFDRGALSWDGYRRYKGYDGEDAPTIEELRLRQELGISKGHTPPPAGTPVPPGDDQPAADPGAPADSEPPPAQAPVQAAAKKPTGKDRGRALARRLLDIDRDLRARIETECDVALRQALMKAGNRTAKAVQASGSREARQVVAHAPRGRLVATLGRAIVAQLGVTDDELLADSFGDLQPRWERLTSQAQAAVLTELATALAQPADSPTLQALAAAQAEHRTQGWTALQRGLLDLAKTRLYDPAVDGEDDPGFETANVPTTLVRRALTIAGGGAAGAAESIQTRQVEMRGGIAIGGDVTSTVTDAGGQVEGYEWVYGVSSNGFPGHEQLTGVQFTSFEDDQLSNDGDWPDEPYFSPGDHDGCSCDAIPLWFLADDPERFYPHSGSEGISAPGEAA